ncbi:MAG TPA: type II secretion system F family protein [Gemmatimonadales bacterium]|nr:type II secretion system F family protein [Gemmatimonadales bacterium]
MIYFATAAFGIAIALIVAVAGQFAPAQPRAVARRLLELGQQGSDQDSRQQRLRRQERAQQLGAVLEWLGGALAKTNSPAARNVLLHAGFRHPNAAAIFWGARLALMAVLGVSGFLVGPLFGGGIIGGILAALWGAVLGWLLPAFYVGSRAKARQKEIQRALPDALDLLVVCVEAGLALNQALVRVATEIKHVSEMTSEELVLTNLEIRAGVPREEALRGLGERTGVPDLRSLVAMLIQTDRFGTSIAQALRVHSDTVRTKRRQRAEEAAAKTTIKLVFPLVLFVFPALFVVILGPAVITMVRTLGEFGP